MTESQPRWNENSGRWKWVRWTATAAGLAGLVWATAHFGWLRAKEWTTSSPEALAAFQNGLDARMRLYEMDAATSFRRALEIDPQFAAAKVQLATTSRAPEERKRLVEELGATDLSRLNPRERFLVETALAFQDPARQRAIADRAYAEHPRDPWILFAAATQAWEREAFADAERLFQELLDVDPNWVTAHNHLGYLAMSQGKFDRAERHFRTYAFVAPDQANPHDSLGELLSLRGRYEEARAEIELALAEKPDFCASYANLLGLSIFQGSTDGVEAVIARARAHCSAEFVSEVSCDMGLIAALFERDYDRPWREGAIECAGKPGQRGAIVHRLALLAGREEVADAEEDALRDLAAAESNSRYDDSKSRHAELELFHEEGTRALLAGDPAKAVEKFRAANERAVYWGASEGRFKLFNLVHLAEALRRSGDEAASRQALDAVREVNPEFAALFEKIVEELTTPASR